MITADDLSKRMQTVCANSGVSQKELADMTGLTKSQISLLWNGKVSNITSKTYFKVTQALNKIEGKV